MDSVKFPQLLVLHIETIEIDSAGQNLMNQLRVYLQFQTTNTPSGYAC